MCRFFPGFYNYMLIGSIGYNQPLSRVDHYCIPSLTVLCLTVLSLLQRNATSSLITSLQFSIMADLALEGNDASGNDLLAINTATAFCGKNYGIGGNPGTDTLANYIEYYNLSALGASVGSHIAEICNANML
ncbi:hypothetical protein BCR43DRAFT_487742 [Syncephalastrum racemosum]|uniref:Uncharacterized protein n=1 Tax=Syncephalastrum racemosum TaxID=13706 RepID=A0A1X2HHQ3_SYNRA|nr:hypothetical protein BCR43DRAFT_487742 [Syncephalastrum racemosum]